MKFCKHEGSADLGEIIYKFIAKSDTFTLFSGGHWRKQQKVKDFVYEQKRKFIG